MGLIREPSGIDFVVDPTPLTNKERKKISEIIAYYKRTGKKLPVEKATQKHDRKSGTRSAADSGKVKLTKAQIQILQLSDADIKNGKLISQEDVDKSDLKWLKEL